MVTQDAMPLPMPVPVPIDAKICGMEAMIRHFSRGKID